MGHRAADELVFDEPCVLFALPREARSFLHDFPPQQRVPDAPCWAQFCGPSWLSALVLTTGMGRASVERALAWLEGPPQLGGVACAPKLLISAGFAGALSTELKVGDLVVASEICDEAGAILPAPWPGELSGAWQPVPHRGRVLTLGSAVGEAKRKQDLARQHSALAVDMESAVVARWCQRRQIPFGCVRVISDDANTSFSATLQDLLAAESPAYLRLVWAGLRSPRLLLEMKRLARDTRLAARQLGMAIGELLTLTLPFGADL